MLAAPANIAVLTTGGTIAGRKSERGAMGYDSGQVTGEDLLAAVPGLERVAKLTTEPVASTGSQDMNDAVWMRLVERIRSLRANSDVDGVLITHGTDTMEETAFFLDLVLPAGAPVVLTGSMRPSNAISADGPANLESAVQVAASPLARGRGVLLVNDREIHAPRHVTKVSTTALAAFSSPLSGPVGYVNPAQVRFLYPAAPRRTVYPLPAVLPRVEIISSHANMDGAQIDAAVSRGAKGIVLAGLGGGNASRSALDAMAKAAKAGILVVRSTRTGNGFTERNVEVPDDQYGFVAALDLNPAKARILTQLLIANGITSPAAAQAAFAEQ